MMNFRIAGFCLGVAVGTASAAPKWWGRLECGSGWNGNPLYLSEEDSLRTGAAAYRLEGDISGKAPLPAHLEIYAHAGAGLDRLPALPRANAHALDGDMRLNWNNPSTTGWFSVLDEVKLGGSADWTDNSILSSTDREEPEGSLVGYLQRRAEAKTGWRLGPAGNLHLDARWTLRDYGEDTSLTYSLDWSESEGAIAWHLRPWRPLELGIDLSRTDRRYRDWYSRDSTGRNRDYAVSRNYVSHAVAGQVELRPVKWFRLKGGYGFGRRTDAYQGYYDRSEHRPRVRAELYWGKWETAIGARRSLFRYDNYRVGYVSRNPIRRIRYDYLDASLRRNIGRLYAECGAGYRGVSGNASGDKSQALVLGLYVGVGF